MEQVIIKANADKTNRTNQNREHICFGCKKFYEHQKNIGRVDNFPIACKLSTDIQLLEIKNFSQDLTEDEKLYLDYAVDPVEWAWFEFGWKARWYQEEILRCSSPMKIIRAGRRLGKTEALAVDILHSIATISGFKALVIAPYQDQVDLIFKKMDELIDKSMTMKVTVERAVDHPSMRREFRNGSVITGITAGVKTGSKSNKVRGQDAHGIWIDEGDMLSQDDLESILAVRASHKDCKLWISGTPTGKRAQFYKWSTDPKSGFKSFHYKSSESPEWTQSLEDWFRGIYTKNAFDQEFNAEFGADEMGVFPKGLVDDSIKNYDLNLRRPLTGVSYGFGVDWNDTASGVQIAIVGYHPQDRKFWLEKIIEVDKAGFTQLSAVEKIVELNAFWNPDFIYVDAGFGETQVELLRQHGIRNQASKLDRRLKAIKMGGTVEIKDPIYGLTKKEVKPFIVNLSVRRFEEGELVLPRSEYKGEGENTLVDQIMAFRIKRVTAEGRPVYDNTKDHSLTAWMLALYGFWMEMDSLSINKNIAKDTSFVSAKKGTSTEEPPAGPFGWFTIEIDKARMVEKRIQENAALRPIPRNLTPNKLSGNMSDVAEQSKLRKQAILRPGSIPIKHHKFGSGRPNPPRKTF